MGFSRQEYWSGLPFPSPGDLPDPGIKPMSLALAGRFFTSEPPGKPKSCGEDPCLKHCYEGNETGGFLTALNLHFSRINVCSVSIELSSLVCRTIWYFHQEDYHGAVAGNSIYCADYSLSRILCNQIRETLLSPSSPYRVPHTVICTFVQRRI